MIKQLLVVLQYTTRGTPRTAHNTVIFPQNAVNCHLHQQGLWDGQPSSDVS